MSEPLSRMRAAWALLRGWSVIRGVTIEYGEVTVRRHNLMVSRAEIRNSEIWTQGPVVLRPGKSSVCEGNEGNALSWPEPGPVLPVTGEMDSHEIWLT